MQQRMLRSPIDVTIKVSDVETRPSRSAISAAPSGGDPPTTLPVGPTHGMPDFVSALPASSCSRTVNFKRFKDCSQGTVHMQRLRGSLHNKCSTI